MASCGWLLPISPASFHLQILWLFFYYHHRLAGITTRNNSSAHMSNADATHYEILSPVTWSDDDDEGSSIVVGQDSGSPAGYGRSDGRHVVANNGSDSDSDETLEPAPVAHSLELESPPAPIRPIQDENSELGRTVSPQFARAHELRIRALRESVRRRQRALETVWSSPTRKRHEETPQEIGDHYHQEPQNDDSEEGVDFQDLSSPVKGQQDISDELIQATTNTTHDQIQIDLSDVEYSDNEVQPLKESDADLAEGNMTSRISDHSSHYESFSPEKSFYDLEPRSSASIKLKPQFPQPTTNLDEPIFNPTSETLNEPEQWSSPPKSSDNKLKDSPKATFLSPKKSLASPKKKHLTTPLSSKPLAARSPAFEDWTPAQWTRLVKDARWLNLRKEDVDNKTPLPPALLRHFPGSSDYSLRLRLQTLFSRKKI